MDLSSDVAVRHLLRFNELHIRHSLDVSPSVTTIAREIRYCVIAVVLGWTTISVVKGILSFRRQSTTSN
jgi:hypothetical protein